jgi:carboxyl-terminal processing protease
VKAGRSIPSAGLTGDPYGPIMAIVVRSSCHAARGIAMKQTSIVLLCVSLMLALPARADSPTDSAISFEDLRAFTDAWGYIRDQYVEDIDDRRLFEAALRGMLGGLDPHSRWLSADELHALEEQTVGRYGGLGIEVDSFDDHLRVISVFGDTPAHVAGIRAGDRIIGIDELDLSPHNIERASDRLRGPAGTEITIRIRRDDRSEVLAMTLMRALIERESVHMAALASGYRHVRIHRFQQTTRDELERLLSQLEREERAPPGLLLDLRNNPGGMLQSAIMVADLFLSSRLVVTAEGRGLEQPGEYRTGPDARLVDVPMVVLVDRGSASAAEILAAALRDHGRAMLVGEPTFGKGSVQTVWPLPNGSAIRLTTAFYYTPAGERIQARGVHPDVLSSATHREQPDPADRRRREIDMERHLPGWIEANDEFDELSRSDPMLADALRVLASISRMQSH